MVQAILDGRKTQTRRTRGLEEINKNPEDWHFVGIYVTDYGEIGATFQNCEEFARTKCPYGKPGDRLWVRETWQITNFLHPSNENYGYVYKASENGKDWQENTEEWKWKPSIHMTKAAARIWLEITEISVERLQDISKEDAIAEGVDTYFNSIVKQDCYRDYLFKGEDWMTPEGEYYYPGFSFRSLWESINGAESWDLNPWLWVIKFKVLSTTGKEAIT